MNANPKPVKRTVPGLSNTVAMVRARHCGANPETLSSNVFQAATTEPEAALHAQAEQQALVASLERSGVQVLMFEPGSDSPDAAFPNNWFSTHADGRLVLYPMEAPSRRRERLPHIQRQLADAGFEFAETIDLSGHEENGRYLEGTGSLVLDRNNRIAYVCASSRSDRELAEEWARLFGYELCWFDATSPDGAPVYHTNVIMAVGPGVALVCLEAVRDRSDRRRLLQRLEQSGQEVIELDWQQVRAFAGNQLFLAGAEGPLVALSASADDALREGQKVRLDSYAKRVVVDIGTIERHGGGSVRCMLAEVFLPTNPE